MIIDTRNITRVDYACDDLYVQPIYSRCPHLQSYKSSSFATIMLSGSNLVQTSIMIYKFLFEVLLLYK